MEGAGGAVDGDALLGRLRPFGRCGLAVLVEAAAGQAAAKSLKSFTGNAGVGQ